jgi:undecaprenyl-diphosphatase
MQGERHATENSEAAEVERQADRRIIRRTRWAEVTFATALIFYTVMAIFARRYAYFSWDVSLDRAIQSISVSGFRALMVAVSSLGSGWPPFALVILAGSILIAKRFRLEGIICMAEVAAGTLTNNLFKSLIGRPRPIEPLVKVTTTVTRESFPSGHVVFFVEFFGFLLFLNYAIGKAGPVRRILFTVLGALVVLVGISRVYLGAHWPSDVVGAYLAGGVWLMLSIEVYRRLKIRTSEGR